VAEIAEGQGLGLVSQQLGLHRRRMQYIEQAYWNEQVLKGLIAFRVINKPVSQSSATTDN
jgi:hypothetical protein